MIFSKPKSYHYVCSTHFSQRLMGDRLAEDYSTDACIRSTIVATALT